MKSSLPLVAHPRLVSMQYLDVRGADKAVGDKEVRPAHCNPSSSLPAYRPACANPLGSFRSFRSFRSFCSFRSTLQVGKNVRTRNVSADSPAGRAQEAAG